MALVAMCRAVNPQAGTTPAHAALPRAQGLGWHFRNVGWSPQVEAVGPRRPWVDVVGPSLLQELGKEIRQPLEKPNRTNVFR